MRFWQAIIIAQMAAGSVWADRYQAFWAHAAADGLNVLIGFLAWRIGMRFWPIEQTLLTVVVNSDNSPSR